MMKRRQSVLTALLFGLLTPNVSLAQRVEARAWVDSTKYLIGDWITVHIGVSHPKGLSFQSIIGDTVNGFHVLERPAFQRISDTSTTAKLVVAKYDSGRAILPGIPLLYSTPGDTAPHTIATNPLLLTISTISVDTTKDIKDVKPPLWISLTLAQIAVYAGIVLLLAALAYLIYRYWKKKQMQRTGQVYIPPPRPAHVIALEELALLKEKKLWQSGLIKQYYSEATEILRRYFENRYHFMALEQTTDEIMRDLRKHVHASEVFDETETLLRRADLVKFAKYQPGVPEHEEMMSGALSIVDKTKLVERPVVAQTKGAAPVYVES
jgi:hypothetical protein